MQNPDCGDIGRRRAEADVVLHSVAALFRNMFNARSADRENAKASA
jgi:hypothetical protein